MGWHFLSSSHTSYHNIIDGTLTAQRYIDEVLRPVVVLLFAAHRDVTHFQHDNARPHSARLTTAFLRQQDINTLPWPAFSPDLSPIEHVWDQLGRAVRQGHLQSQTRQQLEAALQAEWRNIPQVCIQRLICSMPRRCRACVAGGGEHIRY
jgi:transposase